MITARNRLIVVSNRVPVSIERTADGGCRCHPGSGGLVTALAPVMQSRGGVWVGWPGLDQADEAVGAELAGVGERAGYELAPVYLCESEREGFYHGFSNEIIWPLFHDLRVLITIDMK